MLTKKVFYAHLFFLSIPLIAGGQSLTTSSNDEESGRSTIVIYGTELSKSHQPSSLQSIPIRLFEGNQTLVDILDRQPGIIITRQGGSAALATAQIRGVGIGKAEQVLILMDGVRLNPARGSGVDLSKIPLSIVDKIEILKGGESALYGADAVAGVINIVTRKSVPQLSYSFSKPNWTAAKETDHTASLSYGTNWGADSLFFHAHSEKMEGNYGFTNLITEEKGIREHNASRSGGVLVKGNWQPTQGLHIGLTQEWYGAQQQTPGFRLSTGEITKSTSDQQTIRSLTQLSATQQFSNGSTLTLTTPFRVDKLVYGSDDSKYVYKDVHAAGRAHYTFSAGEKHFVHLVGETTWDKLTSLAHNRTPERLNWAGVLKDEFYIHPLVAIVPTLRVDNIENLDTVTTPQLGVSYRALPWLTLHSNIAQSYRAPSFNELYMEINTMGGFYRFTGNPDLKPEEAWDADFGYKISESIFSWEQTFFRNEIENLIADSQLPSGTWTLKNMDRGNIVGIETAFNVRLPWIKPVSTGVNYTWLDTSLPYRAEHAINSHITWNDDILEVSLLHHYLSSRRPATETQDTLTMIQTVGIQSHLKLSSRLTFSAQLQNLFGRPYENVSGFPMPGRTFELSVTGTL